MKPPYFLILLFGILFWVKANGQHITNDIGFFTGNTTILSDYGAKGDFESLFSGAGVSFSVVHYMHFFNTSNRWNSSGSGAFNNLMVKTEATFFSTQLEHTGKWVDPSKTSLIANQLRAMKGSVSIINIGLQLEYYMRDLESFITPYSDMNLNPYITFGVNYALYSNTLEYDETLGLPTKYTLPNALDIGSGSALNFTIGLGTRYNLTEKIDLAAQFQAQIFLTDGLDGVQPDVVENQGNDFITIFQVGIIYNLNFNQPLFSFF